MPRGGATEHENIAPSKGDSDLARDREGDVSVGCARGSCDRDNPQRLQCFAPLIGGIFMGAIHVGLADAPGDENVARSRDRKGAVEAICRVSPFMTVGVRIPIIFRGVAHATGGVTGHGNDSPLAKGEEGKAFRGCPGAPEGI